MTDPAGRYRVTTTIDGRRMLGWWDSLTTAEQKYAADEALYGRDGVTIELVDTEIGETLKTWP